MEEHFQDKGIPMKMLLSLSLIALHALQCSGLPAWTNDYDSSLFEDAINASLMQVNRKSFSRNLFGVVKSSVRTVDFQDDDIFTLVLNLNIQETTCTKASEQDPATCEFQRGPNAKVASCRSWVQVSEEQVQRATVHCQIEDSSSESSSSEEVHTMQKFWGRQDLNRQRSNTKFTSRTISQAYPAGKKSGMSRKTLGKSQNRYQFE